MLWVLFVVSWGYSSSVTSHEFNTEAACKQAIVGMAKAYPRANTFCVPKGQ